MVTAQHTLLLTFATYAASWQWVQDIFNDQQRMVQIGAVIAVAAIFFLARGNK